MTDAQRRDICTKTGGIAWTNVSVSRCEEGTQWVTPAGLSSQQQGCASGNGYEYSKACVYTDPNGLYFWDDGPSMPPAAEAFLVRGIHSTDYRYTILMWEAGQRHDYCYHHHATYGFTKENCDTEFKQIMDGICGREFPYDWLSRSSCYSVANTMHQAVVHFGQEAFEATNTYVNYLKQPTSNSGAFTVERVGGPGAEFVVDKWGGLYALSPRRDAVYKHSGAGWRWIGGAAQHIYGGDTLYASAPNNAGIFRYSGGSWTQLGGPGAAFAVTKNGALFGLSPGRDAIYAFDAATGSWSWIGGAAEHLYTGSSVLFASAPGNQAIRRYGGTPGSWEEIGGPGVKWVVSGNTIYGLTPGKTAVTRYDGSRGWTQIGGPAQDIFAGAQGWELYATSPEQGGPGRQLMRWDGYSGWTWMGGPTKAVVAHHYADPVTPITVTYAVSYWDGNLLGYWPR